MATSTPPASPAARPAAGRGRPDHRRPLDLRRARLPRHRPRARLAERHRPRRIHRRHRRRSAGGLPAAVPDRGHHPRARAEPRDRCRGEAGEGDGQGLHHPREFVRARGQGHLHGRGEAGRGDLTELAKFIAHATIGIVIVFGLIILLKLIPALAQNEFLGLRLNLLVAILIGVPLANLARRRVFGIRYPREK